MMYGETTDHGWATTILSHASAVTRTLAVRSENHTAAVYRPQNLNTVTSMAQKSFGTQKTCSKYGC